MADISGRKIGYAMCGSFCTFEKSIEQLRALVEAGADVTPIMSFNAYSTDTRFGKAEDINRLVSEICGKEIIRTIAGAEPIGPKKMFDVLVVAPCTGNTAAKLANGIIDTPVTMAVKSHLRNSRPVVIAIATNDALSGAAKNIGMIENFRGYYFVPYGQDDSAAKPTSLIADFSKLIPTVECALDGKQYQPMIVAGGSQ